MDKSIQVQNLVLDYFKDTNNQMVSDFVDCFVYDAYPRNPDVSQLVEKFLSENGIENSYRKICYDKSQPKQMFSTANHSDRSIISDVQNALLNLVFNRFRVIDHTPVKKIVPNKVDKVKLLADGDEEESVHIISNVYAGSEYTLCGIDLEGSFISGVEKQNVTGKVNCTNCRSIVKQCKNLDL